MMNLNLIETKTKENAKQEIYEIADYKVIVDYMDNEMYNISIRSDWTKDYIADIYADFDIWSTKLEGFRIQTTAYGSKDVETIQEIIKSYQTAIEVVKVLEETFMK